MSTRSAELAPIIVFAYARPEHLRRTIEALRANSLASQSSLVVSCDGPRGVSDHERCAAVRAFCDSIDGFATTEIWLSEANQGLSQSVIAGVSRMLQLHDRVIVLEDDLVVSPHFLRFMNDGLDCYESSQDVASIHGYCYPTSAVLAETFFLRGADCWGWATWARAWSHFEADGGKLLAQLKERDLGYQFDLDGSYPFLQMLEDQISGRNDSWAIRWHASCFLKGMLTLYPGRSLVHNIGNDGSGTHALATRAFDQHVHQKPVNVRRSVPAESVEARAAFSDYLRTQSGPWRSSASWMRDVFRKVLRST